MRSISHCLNKQLADICQRSVQLEELADKIAKLLPEPFVKEFQVGSFNKGCLVLTTTSSVWASQLHYMIPELRDKLRKEGGMYQLSSIKVMVVEPPVMHEKKTPPQKHKLSDKAKATIISESQYCTYEPLQKALLNLAESSE